MSVGKRVCQISSVVGQSFVVRPLLACEFGCSLVQEGVYTFSVIRLLNKHVKEDRLSDDMSIADVH